MGQEIEDSHFRSDDFSQYERLLDQEWKELTRLADQGRFSEGPPTGGLELEAWLIDYLGEPTPWNSQVIHYTGSNQVVPELARYNLEFNVSPQLLQSDGLARMMGELEELWRVTDWNAERLGSSLISIGLLPTLKPDMLTLGRMSPLQRFKALNQQIRRLRQGQPVPLDIEGRQRLHSQHADVMLESAATSLQLHLQTPFSRFVRYYNAAVMVSAATVALAANSPYLFGHDLWEESRIPLLEQALFTSDSESARVSFGQGYLQASPLEIFDENRRQFSVLLPTHLEEHTQSLYHHRLLNGTIWRWNRPLIGHDQDGCPHVRLEHRVMAAGPTMVDMAANMALFYGLVESLVASPTAAEASLEFQQAKRNFYQAARYGLQATVRWIDGHEYSLDRLVLDELIPRAAEGLQRLQVDSDWGQQHLEIIRQRCESGQTGAAWQRRYVEVHGPNFTALIRTYRNLQHRGEPVHRWDTGKPQVKGKQPVVQQVRRSMLEVTDQLPYGLLAAKATELHELPRGPTLIHLPGRRPERLLVCIMLHGNEDVGLLALQSCLRKYADQPLPRALSVFVGNVEAARANVRFLPHQPDYNRVWPGTPHEESPERTMLQHVVDQMRQYPYSPASICTTTPVGTHTIAVCGIGPIAICNWLRCSAVRQFYSNSPRECRRWPLRSCVRPSPVNAEKSATWTESNELPR